MKIEKLTIKNFKSVYDEVTFDFNDITGFWKIAGTVGSGKTTIGEAIIYGLFGSVNGKTNKDLLSWGQKKGYVIIDCISKGNKLHIVRNIKGDLEITSNGEPIIFTNKIDAQKQLENEYYDVSRMTLELLCIISFNNFKSLSNLSAGDSRAFLDQVFGFQTLTNLSEQCKLYKKSVSDILQKQNTEKYALESQIAKIKQLSDIEIIEGNAEKIKGENSHIELEINELNKKIKQIRDKNQSEIISYNSQLNEITIVGKNLAKEISFIEQGKCPTCGAPIDQSELENKKKEKSILSNSYKEISEKLNTIKNSQSNEISDIENTIRSKREVITKNNSLITKLKEQERRAKINIGQIEELQNKISDIDIKIDDLTKDVDEWNMLGDLLANDIRKKILSNFIPALNKSIQQYTEKIKLPYTITFDDMFKCSINLFGFKDPISISSLSTGQLKMVDMCIILGVLKVIMSSISFNIIFLDELFSNMDLDLRNMICYILKSEIAKGQTLFVISHAEDNAKYDGIITAETRLCNNTKNSEYLVKKLI